MILPANIDKLIESFSLGARDRVKREDANPESESSEASAREAGSHGNGGPPPPGSRPERLHPALEVRRNLLLFGFREEVTTEGDEEERKVRLLSLMMSDEGPTLREVEGRVLTPEGSHYVVPKAYDYPPLLEEEWSREDLDDFLESPSAASPRELYEQLRKAVHRHVDLDAEGAEVLVSLYPAISFVFPVFPALPFLLFLGPKETGKSQSLDVLSELCRAGHKSRATAASIGDLVESRRATLLLDQADSLKDADGLIDLLTDSYRRGARRTVTDVDHRGRPHEFRTYAPKAFAAHENPDDDLLDRCIQFPMSPAARSVEPLLAEDDHLDRVRHELYRFTALYFQALYQTRAVCDDRERRTALDLDNRPWELFRPFDAVFEWLDVPTEDREAALNYFRQSLTNTSAELSEDKAAVLRALARLERGRNCGDLHVLSSELESIVRAEVEGPPELTPSRAKLGSILRDFSLVRDKNRPRLEGQRLTEWIINTEQLHRALDRWDLKLPEDEADTSGPGKVRVPVRTPKGR